MSERELERLIRRYDPQIAAQARDALAKLRLRLPGFGATDKASDAVLSVIVCPDHLTLCFLHGASLRDPQHVLLGEGKRVRHLRLRTADTLDEPVVASFIAQSVGAAQRKSLQRNRA